MNEIKYIFCIFILMISLSGCIEENSRNDIIISDDGHIFYDIGFQINKSNGFLLIPLPYYEKNSSIIYPPINMETVNSTYGNMIKVDIDRFFTNPTFSILIPYLFEIQKIQFESHENNQIKVFSSFSGSVSLVIIIQSGMANEKGEFQKIMYDSLEGGTLIENEWISLDFEKIN